MQTEDRLQPEDLTDREALAQAEALIRQVQKNIERRGNLNIFTGTTGKLQKARGLILEVYADV